MPGLADESGPMPVSTAVVFSNQLSAPAAAMKAAMPQRVPVELGTVTTSAELAWIEKLRES